MLRELLHEHIASLIAGATLTTTATPAASFSIGGQFFTSIARAAAGTGTLTLKGPFARTPLVVGVGSSVDVSTSGGCFARGTAPTTSVLTTKTGNGSSATDDGTCHVWTLGWGSSDANNVKVQRVDSPHVAPRVEVVKINGSAGTLAFGGGFARLTKNGTGDYTLTFKRSFARTPIPMASSQTGSTASRQPLIASVSAEAVRVICTNLGGTAEDQNVYVGLYGSDCTHESARGHAPVENSQRKPRLLAFGITNAGSPSVSVNSVDGSVALNATGDITVTFAKPFKREPALFVSGLSTRACIHTGAAASARIATRGVTSDSLANDDVHLIAIGFDDASEY